MGGAPRLGNKEEKSQKFGGVWSFWGSGEPQNLGGDPKIWGDLKRRPQKFGGWDPKNGGSPKIWGTKKVGTPKIWEVTPKFGGWKGGTPKMGGRPQNLGGEKGGNPKNFGGELRGRPQNLG